MNKNTLTILLFMLTNAVFAQQGQLYETINNRNATFFDIRTKP